MEVIKEVTKVEKKVVDYLCNKCGESCKFQGATNGFASGDAYSMVLENHANYCYSLCEICLTELFETFKLPVTIHRYDEDGDLII